MRIEKRFITGKRPKEKSLGRIVLTMFGTKTPQAEQDLSKSLSSFRRKDILTDPSVPLGKQIAPRRCSGP